MLNYLDYNVRGAWQWHLKSCFLIIGSNSWHSPNWLFEFVVLHPMESIVFNEALQTQIRVQEKRVLCRARSLVHSTKATYCASLPANNWINRDYGDQTPTVGGLCCYSWTIIAWMDHATTNTFWLAIDSDFGAEVNWTVCRSRLSSCKYSNNATHPVNPESVSRSNQI